MPSLIEQRSSYGDLIKGVGIDFSEVFNEEKEAYVSPLGEMLVNPKNKKTALIKERKTEAAKVHFEGKSGTKLTTLTSEGADYATDIRYFGYKTDFVPQKFTNSVSVTEEAREDIDRRWKAELDEYRDLITGALRREASAMFDIFNYGFTAQSSLPAHVYPYGDGVPLFSLNHPRLDSGAVQANTFSAAVTQLPLSESSFELGRINILRQLDSRGQPLQMNRGAMTLVVPVELEKTAMILTMSIKRPGTANNDTNIYDGMAGVIASNWLSATSTTAWFLVETLVSKLMFIRRQSVQSHNVLDRNKTQTFYVSHRFCVGWAGWTGCFGSLGDSTAYSG